MRSDGFVRKRSAGARTIVGNKRFVLYRGGVRDYRAFQDAGMFGERSLNFLELHPESPYLDLIIDPADEIECSVGPKPDQIAGPVHTLRNAIASIELDEPGKRQ